MGKLLKQVKINIFNSEFECVGYIDSGNMLYDEDNGEPVIVLSKHSLKKLLNHQEFDQLQKSLNLNNPKVGTLRYSTLGGFCSEMFLITPNKVEIVSDGKSMDKNCKIGLIDKKFVNFDVLLSRDFV